MKTQFLILRPWKRFLRVSVNDQRLYLVENHKIIRRYRVSTAKAGTGNKAGSGRTPLGIHRIFRKIGKGAVKGTVFKDRINTREVWDGKSVFGDLILSRILWLDGVEPGVNKGHNIDTRARYIYIHGTNHRKGIGRPASHGCVTMKCEDIIDLFGRVRQGDRVVIT
ncbi:MAG: L,D-transpeptidase [Fibrobacterota bacterium]